MSASHAQGESVILHLRNGDRLAGEIVSENTNQVVLATSWIKELPVPVAAILRREPLTNAAPVLAVEQQTVTPAKTNVVAAAKPVPPPVAPASPPKPPTPKHWKVNLNVGTDTQFGAHDRQLYTGRLKLTYELPYKSDPKKFFRSILDYAVDYGKTDGVKSADRMYGTVKTDFDIGPHLFVYNLGGAGYDDIRKINLEYEEGPGVGYHLFTKPKFVMNVEGGINYQAQHRSSSDNVENFYYRLAEDITWKITSRLTLVEKAELFPQVEDPDKYRARFDATLSFALWENISFNLSVLDLYDTNPAQGVDNNEVQVRSMLGVTF